MLSCFSCVWLFVTPWTVAFQGPQSMGFPMARILEWVAIFYVIYNYIYLLCVYFFWLVKNNFCIHMNPDPYFLIEEMVPNISWIPISEYISALPEKHYTRDCTWEFVFYQVFCFTFKGSSSVDLRFGATEQFFLMFLYQFCVGVCGCVWVCLEIVARRAKDLLRVFFYHQKKM